MSAKKIKLRKKKEDRPLVVEQWVEIEVFDGITKTTRYPDDAEVRKLIDEKQERNGRAVDLVYRRLNFVHGVPDEYDWATNDPMKRKYGGHAIQRLRVGDWLDLCKVEEGGHMQASKFHMPRPEARGGCECEGCVAMAERIARTGR